MDKKLDKSQKCALAAQKTQNCVLGCIKREVISRRREGIVMGPLLGPICSTAPRPRAPSTKKTWSCQSGSRSDRSLLLRQAEACSEEKRRLHEDLTVVFGYLKGAYSQDRDWLYTWTDSDRTREDGFKLKEGRSTLDVRRIFFIQRLVKHWNKLPRKVVVAPSLKVFKPRLDEVLGSWSSG